jgi:hypothetical protein
MNQALKGSIFYMGKQVAKKIFLDRLKMRPQTMRRAKKPIATNVCADSGGYFFFLEHAGELGGGGEDKREDPNLKTKQKQL